jgi:methylated-DNA-protein-cysteine methyltransferase-like protein
MQPSARAAPAAATPSASRERALFVEIQVCRPELAFGRRRLMSLSPENVYAIVRSIPRGKVATYGQIAELAGVASGHRIVARAMRSCPERLPWQRVVGKKDARRGQINIVDPDHAALQRGLLESEGVVFVARGFIPLGRFGWHLDELSSERRKSQRSLSSRRVQRRAKKATRRRS